MKLTDLLPIVPVRRSNLIAGLLVTVASGCHTPIPPKHSTTVYLGPGVTNRVVISTNFSWSLPSKFPSFGVETPDSIRVAIFGYAVNRQGYYYFAPGATVSNAIHVTNARRVDWQGYSGIQRKTPDGLIGTIWFSRATRFVDEQRILQNNDRLMLSHEVY